MLRIVLRNRDYLPRSTLCAFCERRVMEITNRMSLVRSNMYLLGFPLEDIDAKESARASSKMKSIGMIHQEIRCYEFVCRMQKQDLVVEDVVPSTSKLGCVM